MRSYPLNTHPTRKTAEQQVQEELQVLINQGLQTLVGLCLKANEVENDLEIIFARCKFIQKNNACSTTCPMWDGEQCLAKKWKELMVEEYGWTPEITQKMLGLYQKKPEEEVKTDAGP
jgi:hypothetical protein